MGREDSQDRRYQVFISSTYLDLKEERQEVIQALLELDCFPAGMELFPASNDERWDLIKSVIDDSDYYLVIIGGRYGSTDKEGISYTEREYDYAIQTRKPVLGFIHAEPGNIPQKHAEKDPDLQQRLDGFRKKVGQRMCKMWSSPAELGSVVSRGIIRLTNTNPAEGWVRARNALTSEAIEEMAGLRQQVAEYQLERERSRTAAPVETEQFAQGVDVVELEYEFVHSPSGDLFYGDDDTEYNGSVELSWDELFRALGPLMFSEASEEQLTARLVSTALAKASQDDTWPKQGSVRNFALSAASFDEVKVQLVALRLIEKSDRKHGVNDSRTYWKLSPFGETHVMSLLATRRGEKTVARGTETPSG